MSAPRFLAPSSAGLRQPGDAAQINGQIINPPRYAELGGLTGPSKVGPNVSKGGIGTNHLNISKPNGGR